MWGGSTPPTCAPSAATSSIAGRARSSLQSLRTFGGSGGLDLACHRGRCRHVAPVVQDDPHPTGERV
jgi:hypothetical protein